MNLSNIWTFTHRTAKRAELWLVSLLMMPMVTFASTTGGEFQPA